MKDSHKPHRLVIIGLILFLIFAITKCTVENEKRSYELKNKTLAVGQVWEVQHPGEEVIHEKRIVKLYKNWVLFIQDTNTTDTIAELRYWFLVNSENKSKKDHK